jgi:diacylglycerol kinase (ATP)
MTSYVDVDTSEEALQEDVELQEAVEQIVAKGAEIIIEDVKNDVNGVYEQFKAFLLGLFPFIVAWSENHALFWIDMEHIAITSCLFVVFFWFLSPWGDSSSSSRNHRSNETNKRRSIERSKSMSSIKRIRDHIGKKHDNLPNLQNSAVGDEMEEEHMRLEHEEEESEVQKFAKRWPIILKTSQYRCLVLPPGCKRVEKSYRRNINSNRKEQGGSKQESELNNKSTKTFTDENPGTRLVNYMKQVFHLIVLFRRYDYTTAGRTLITWVQSAIRARNSNNSRTQERGMEDDEDEDESVTSELMVSSSNTSTTDDETDYDKFAHIDSNRSKRLSCRLSRSKKQKSRIKLDDSPIMPKNDNQVEDQDENDNADNVNTVFRDLSSSAICDDAEVQTPRLDKIEDKADDNLFRDAILRDEAIMKNLLKTPPRLSSGSENQQFFTPTLDKNETSSVGASSTSSSPSPSSLIPPSLIPPSLRGKPHAEIVSKTSLPTIKSRSLATGTKTRDALANYRIETSRRDFGLNSNSNSPPQVPLFVHKLSPPSTESTASFFFETVGSHESIRRMAVDVPVPDNNGYILGDEFLPNKSFTPLLVFVNSRSGPQQGHLLTTQLRGLLNPIQIWDLADGAPEEILESFSTFTRLRILVCGGDGTVSWIVSTIESMEMQRWPPIAILPLGTGNDLARIHGWGGGYSNESLIKILEQVSEGYVSWLDRWEMTNENKKGKVRSVQSFLNYLSVGADAAAALQVHMLRESRPQLFFSRIVNKLWYGLFGAEDIIKASSMNLRHDITLIADGIEVPLPADSQGIIMLNIDSYTGGVPLWATGHTAFDSESNEVGNSYDSDFGPNPLKRRSKSFDDVLNAAGSKLSKSSGATAQHGLTSLYRADSVEDIASLVLTDDEKYTRVTACDRPSSCQDGLLDIVSVRGTFHLGQIRVGLSNAQKICQCREATIIIKRKVSVQIDGEPWRQNVCTLRIRRKKNAAIMLHRSADESNGVETEMAKLLDWAKTRHLIDDKVHEALMKEFSRRIESKTRQRRVQSNDNLMTSLKRAINNAGHSTNHNTISASIGGANSTGISF